MRENYRDIFHPAPVDHLIDRVLCDEGGSFQNAFCPTLRRRSFYVK
jgi:hypothetical protein